MTVDDAADVTTPTTARLAIATASALGGSTRRPAAARGAARARRVATDVVVWDDPTVDWSTYSHVLIRSTWDYTERPRLFTEWTRRVGRTSVLLNPADVVVLEHRQDVPARPRAARPADRPTIWLDPERNFDARAIRTRFPAFGDFVVKPTVSASSRDTGRYQADGRRRALLAIRHARTCSASSGTS